MIHLPCTNGDTLDDPESGCKDGHDWPDIGQVVTLKTLGGHRIVGSEVTATFPGDQVVVVDRDTDIHCVMVCHDRRGFRLDDLKVWVDLDDLKKEGFA